MLRASPSKIELSHRDISWHRQRFEKRKVEHETLSKRSRAGKQASKLSTPPTDVKTGMLRDSSDDLLYSEKPPANESDAFWASVMSNAVSPQVEVLPSRPLLEAAHEQSCRSTSLSQSYCSAVSELSAQDDPVLPSLVVEGMQSGRLRSPSASSPGKENGDGAIERPREEVIGTNGLKSSLHADDTQTQIGRSVRLRYTTEQRGQSDIAGLDGIKESTSGLNKSPSASAGTAEASKSGHPSRKEYPSMPPVVQSIEKLRSRSGHLPRSPLHIAHAAASSSPDKRVLNSTTPVSTSGGTPTGLLSLPPRRPAHTKTPATTTRSRHNADDSPSSHRTGIARQPDPGVPSAVHQEALEYRLPISEIRMRTSTHAESLDGTFMDHETPDSAGTSWLDLDPHPSRSESPSPTRRTLFPVLDTELSWRYSSAYAADGRDADPKQADRHGAPTVDRLEDDRSSSPTLPTMTLAWRPRTKATGHALRAGTYELPPSSPPVRPRVNNDDPIVALLDEIINHRPGPARADRINDQPNWGPSTPPSSPLPTVPSTPVRHPRTPHTPARSIRVYDDSLPPTSQPQTPIGLPRHGIPHMYMAGSFTAPPARSRTGRLVAPELARRRGMTPGRFAGFESFDYFRGLESRHDQENAAEDETEFGMTRDRRPRGRAASGNAREILDVTPPGEDRRRM